MADSGVVGWEPVRAYEDSSGGKLAAQRKDGTLASELIHLALDATCYS